MDGWCTKRRDLEGVTVECRRADGETTWEPGMVRVCDCPVTGYVVMGVGISHPFNPQWCQVFALDALGSEEGGCTNLEGIGQPGKVRTKDEI